MNEEQRTEPDSAPEELIPPPTPEAPSRFTLWLRRALGWAIAVILVFALGAAANWWFQARPKAARVEQLTAQLEAARSELETLRPQAAEADELQTALDQAERQMLALQALAHVNDARVALAEGRTPLARVPVRLADDRLADLMARVDSVRAEAIAAIRDRLIMAHMEISVDLFAATRDLEVVAHDLDELVSELAAE